MICDLCGKDGASVRLATRSYGCGDRLLVVEKVPVVRCTRCGESYLTAQTLHLLERIKSRRRPLAKKRPVLVAQFS